MAIIIFCLFTLLLCSMILTSLQHMRRSRRLPPGPWPLPVIGNLHLLGSLPHRAFQALALKYGPIMSIHLGQVPAVVISNSQAAEQVLRAHDAVFASRPKLQVSNYVSYGGKGVSLTEHGSYWRFTRKVCSQHLLSVSRIESFAPQRRREVRSMMERLRKAAERREVVNVSEKANELVEELTFKMVVGSDVDIVNFKSLAREGVRLIGTPNLADFVPFLGPLDLQGLTRKMVKLYKEIDETLDKIISEVQEKTVTTSQDKHNKPMSFVEVMLTLMNEQTMDKINNPHEDQYQEYTFDLTNVKAMIADMIGASFETSVTAIDWTLTELMRNPKIMARVHQELNEVVGTNRLVEEDDLPKLTYLEMVIMESFRLHPVSPLLVPHESIEDVEINGYFIPKKTRVFINNCALGRDKSVWSDNADEFIPDRFVGLSDLGYKGNNFKYIPFGSGRRGCPGTQLGLTTVRLVVAQFVHCFTWELPNGMIPSELDMTEKFGLTVPRANHLYAFPTYRLS